MAHDEWKEVWTWARALWGDNADRSFERFFRGIARERAEAEGWEELGSSDAWHASYETVKALKAAGTIKTRLELVAAVQS